MQRRTIDRREKTSLLATTGLVLGIVLLALASLTPVRAGPGQQALNSVQVYIQTTEPLKFDTYVVTAYNSTGFAVASTQTVYPAASFELPSGTFIFTASAQSQVAIVGSNMCYPTVTQGSSSTPPTSTLPAKALPICGYPASEYGYSQQQVPASTVVNITTRDPGTAATSSVTVKVAFVNGTTASGASVSAYVLGGSYYLPDGKSMWGTTDSSGSATLTVPALPIQVTAWLSVPVDIPASQTTVTRIVGGEKVNVTVYWQPTTISLTGSAVIVPPQSGASITLRVQQSVYYPMIKGAGGVAYASGSSTGIAVGGAQSVGIPPSETQQQTSAQVSAPIEQAKAGSAPQPEAGVSITVLMAMVGIAVAASVASLGLVIRRTRHHP